MTKELKMGSMEGIVLEQEKSPGRAFSDYLGMDFEFVGEQGYNRLQPGAKDQAGKSPERAAFEDVEDPDGKVRAEMSPGRAFGDYIAADFNFIEEHNRLHPDTALTRLKRWFSRYFVLEQALHVQLDRAQEDAPFHVRYRNWIALLAPIIIIHIVWWSYMGATGSFGLFGGTIEGSPDPRWTIALTMVFGSLVAGATCQAGGSIAFPVLTIILGVSSSVARDFCFLVQSVGMGAAAFSIWFMGVRVDRRAIVYCSIGGAAGVIFGLERVVPKLHPEYSEMYHVCIWFSFALSLFLLSFVHDQKRRFFSIPIWRKGDILRLPLFSIHTQVDFVLNWWISILVVFGFLGGVFTAICGSGIDICCFALLTLYFRVSERVATPTAVVLMAINSMVACAYRYSGAGGAGGAGGVDAEVYRLWQVCIPIVAVGAPLGAVVSSHFHRHALSALVCIVDTAQMTGALALIQPWTTQRTQHPIDLCIDSALILVSGCVFFAALSLAGSGLLGHVGPVEEDDSIVSAPFLASKTAGDRSMNVMNVTNVTNVTNVMSPPPQPSEGAAEGTEEDGGPVHVVHVVEGHSPSDRDHAAVPV